MRIAVVQHRLIGLGRRGLVAVALAATAAAVLIGAAWADQAQAALPGIAAPAVNTFRNGIEQDVFYRGDDGGLWETWYRYGHWHGPSEIRNTAGTVASAPSSSQTNSDITDVYYRSVNNGIWHIYYKIGSGWHGPTEVPGTAGHAASGPSVIRYGETNEVFYRDFSGAIDQAYYSTGVGWRHYRVADTEGTVTADPVAEIYGSGINVFYRGPNAGLYQEAWTPTSGWRPVTEIPNSAGTMYSSPAAVTFEGNSVDVFYRGANAGMYQQRYNSGHGWTGPIYLPRTAHRVASGPTADVFAGGAQLQLYFFLPSGRLNEYYYQSRDTWHGPFGFGYAAVTPPHSTQPVVVPPPPSAPTTIPPPPPAPPHHKARVRVGMVIGWKWNSRGTWLRKVKALKVPRNARISVRCFGRHCPTIRKSVRPRYLPSLWRRIERPLYHPGNRVVIYISQPGRVTERIQVRARTRKRPAIGLLR